MNTIKLRLLAPALAIALASPAFAQVIMSTTSSYTQDFNSPAGLANTGTVGWVDDTNIASWYWQNTGSGTTYVANTGSGTAGTKYSYGPASDNDRAMGSIGSANAVAGHFAWGVLLKNTSGNIISDIKVSYTGEQWRKSGVTTPQVVTFWYQTSPSTITALTPNNPAGWTPVTGLDFSSPTNTTTGVAIDGNNPANQVSFSNVSIPSLSLADGNYIMLRWDDPDHSGADHGLSIDNVSISWTANATVPTVGFEVGGTSIVEGATATINVTMGTAPSSEVKVKITDLLTGSAVSGTDYNVHPNDTLTFPAIGSYPMTQSVSIVSIDNLLLDGTRTVNLDLSVITGTSNTSITAHTVTITNDDLAQIVINEVDYDQPSTDTEEFIELKNIGSVTVDLFNFKVELVNGSNGAVYAPFITLPSYSLAPGGYYVICTVGSVVPNCNQTIPLTLGGTIQNGPPDAIGLRDLSNNLLDAVSYEGNTAGYTEVSGTLLLDPGNTTATGASIGRIPDGVDSNNNDVDWQTTCVNTPGAANTPSVDTDGDLAFDCVDGCPTDPLKLAPGVCGCNVAETDTDFDGVADCVDGCPTDPFKVVPGQCGCNVADTDTDGDFIADCVDACPNDPLNDSDGDGICGDVDDCPLLFGEQGDPCTDFNPFTIGDVIDGSCVCAGTPVPCTEDVLLEFQTDDSASQTSWEIKDDDSPFVVCSGSGYANNTSYALNCCLVPGCYILSFFDTFGDGLCCGTPVGEAGYNLYDENGKRIIDSWKNGAFGSTSSIGQPFCVPIGVDKMTIASCDREDLLPTSVVVASENAAVTTQFGITNGTSGYGFWIYDPHGTYSRRIFLSHANPGHNIAPGPTEAAHLRLSQIVSNPVPQNILLNIRVRGRVAGTYAEFGPACRLKIDASAAYCPAAHLDNNPLHIGTTYSCDVTGKVVGAAGNNGKIWASPAIRNPGAIPANRYQFVLAVPFEGYSRTITINSYTLVLGPWAATPLLCGTYYYDVKVRASFDAGATWCPYGINCTVEITNNGGLIPCTAPFNGSGNQNAIMDDGGTVLSMWPNPNRGDQLYLQMTGIGADVTTVSVDVHDLFGKRVMGEIVTTGGGDLNHVMELGHSLASGMYTVTVAAGDRIENQRLVVE